MNTPTQSLETPAPRITVVSGLPRSGTSMVMAMLEAGGVPLLTDDVRAPDADNPGGYFEFEPVRRLLSGDRSWLRAAAGRAVKVVVPLVRSIPPGVACDVILLDRALSEVLASQSAMLARLGRAASSPELLRPAFGRQWARTRQHLDAEPAVRLLPLPHARVVADPLWGAAQIATFLSRPLDLAAMAAAVDPGLYRQRCGAAFRPTP